MSRAFRFGVQAGKSSSAEEWRELAITAEDLGFSSLLVPDHLDDQLAPLPALMAAADATSTLKVGTLVLSNDYRHPAVLAKEVATLDLLSGGRVEFGIGAGWMTSDYSSSGIAMETAAIRIDRLTESIQVLKGLWSNNAFTFRGNYYSISILEGTPKPIQQPHPTLILGGGGTKMLTLAAHQADIVGINPSLPNGNIDTVPGRELLAAALNRKVELVRLEAGPRWNDLEINIMVFGVVTNSNASAIREHAAEQFSMTPDELAGSPYAWFGEPSEICDKLRDARERWGINYFVVHGRESMLEAAPILAELAGT